MGVFLQTLFDILKNFVVETKNTTAESLRNEEKQKIRHAEKFFGDTIKIKFRKQFSNKKIENLIREIISL